VTPEPQPLSDIYEHLHTIRADEIDALGHANNLSYLRWMLSAAVAHSASLGLTAETYRQMGSGFVVRRHEIDYLRPAFEGESLVIRTWVASMRKATSLRRYEMFRLEPGREVKLAVAATDWAFVDYTKGMPRRIPEEIVQIYTRKADRPSLPKQ